MSNTLTTDQEFPIIEEFAGHSAVADTKYDGDAVAELAYVDEARAEFVRSLRAVADFYDASIAPKLPMLYNEHFTIDAKSFENGAREAAIVGANDYERNDQTKVHNAIFHYWRRSFGIIAVEVLYIERLG